jgi:hypothetical protein
MPKRKLRVTVVSCNDFPERVMRSEEKAEAWVREQNESERQRMADEDNGVRRSGMPRRYYHCHTFELED